MLPAPSGGLATRQVRARHAGRLSGPGAPKLDDVRSARLEATVNSTGADSPAGVPARPRLSVGQLLAAKHTKPIASLDDLAAETFESDQELEEFLAFTYAERRRDLA
jgi:hypothetical protein